MSSVRTGWVEIFRGWRQRDGRKSARYERQPRSVTESSGKWMLGVGSWAGQRTRHATGGCGLVKVRMPDGRGSVVVEWRVLEGGFVEWRREQVRYGEGVVLSGFEHARRPKVL